MGPDLTYETNQIDRIDNAHEESRPHFETVIPADGEVGGNNLYAKNNRGQAIDNPDFTEESKINNESEPKIHTGLLFFFFVVVLECFVLIFILFCSGV